MKLIVFNGKALLILQNISGCIFVFLFFACGNNNFKHSFSYNGYTKMIELNDSINQSWPDQTFHEIYFRNLFLFPDGIQLLDSSLIHHSFKGEYYMLNLDLEQQKFLVSNYQLKIKNSSFVSNFNKPKVYSLSKYEEPYSFICYSKGDTLNIYCLDLNIRVFCSMKSIDPDDFIRELIHGDESRFDFWAL